MIIRSNCPDKLDKNDLDYLKKIGINNIIDLRDIDEYENKKSSFEGNNDFNLYHVIIKGGKEVPKSRKEVPLSYIKMIDENKEGFLEIFKILAQNDGGILYFCNAGKDRTGVLTALILMLLNIENEKIIDDYMITKECQEKFLNAYIMEKKDDSLRERIIPHEEFMMEFIKLLKEKYESVQYYLVNIGLKEEEIEKIKSKILI